MNASADNSEHSALHMEKTLARLDPESFINPRHLRPSKLQFSEPRSFNFNLKSHDMFSVRGPSIRASLPTLSKRIPCPSTNRSFSLLNNHTLTPHHKPAHHRRPITSKTHLSLHRHYSAKSSADTLIEEINDQYAVARDEFEISTEETEKQSIYAQADRDAAREELDKLKEMYEKALQGSDGEEIRSRIGGRIRELDHAVQALEESATEH
ncbi:uncharacterized protein RAG0_00599 [Rhynchosporium agropyri]|uniref:Uncharacterized protein n=1 Tax=Rhynchosporium agropyri TaxID=914238 RepID=A0A1E1JTS0_9HELO|nr:uncharacterized protein RAG0_00599 [Rhynchosporium agropyri]